VGPAKHNRFQGRYVMWVDGCSGNGGLGGVFGSTAPLSGPQATSTKLIDPFEQLLVADLPELDVKAVPLAKDAPPLPYTPPVQPQQVFAPPPRRQPTSVQFVVSEVSAGFDVEVIKRALLRHRPVMTFCYENELQKNPSLKGKMALRFVIGPDGAVTSAEPAESTVGPELEACVLGRIRRVAFPVLEGGASVNVKLLLVFAPGS
jgi:hypothetical protein